MSELAERECIPCKGGIPPLTPEEIAPLTKELNGEWRVEANHHLEREFRFDDFRSALDFTNAVGELSEEQGHHPLICLTWGSVTVRIWTHKINGLSESDFILAAKIERLTRAHYH